MSDYEREMQMKGYWSTRDKKAELAKLHTITMEKQYKDLIQKAINDSKIYSPNHKFNNELTGPTENISVQDETSQDAIFNKSTIKDGKTAVLNFASYKNPGGMFIKGSSAQEESLCHASFLYNVLKEKQSYYDENAKNLNKGAYTNRAIYTPDVKFFKNESDKILEENIDVITCAAPNYSVAKYGILTKDKNSQELDSRIKFVLDIAAENKVNNLILGAYGCGVFAQDAQEVATIFKKYLDYYKFDNVVFAIPYSENYKTFKEIFDTSRNIEKDFPHK